MKNQIKKTILLVLLAALSLFAASCGCGGKKDEKVTEVLYANFEQWAYDFQLMRVTDGFGATGVNSNTEYVKSGKQSLLLHPLGGYRTGTMPYVFFPTASELFGFDYRDFTDVEYISFEIMNTNAYSVKVAAGLITAVDNVSLHTKTNPEFTEITSGWSTVTYAVNPSLLQIIYDVKDIQGFYLAFENAGTREVDDAPYIYVDDIKIKYSEQPRQIEDVVKLDEMEILSFEKEYQNYVFTFRESNAASIPYLEIVKASGRALKNDKTLSAVDGENVLRFVTYEGSVQAATWPGFSLSNKILAASNLTKLKVSDYDKIEFTFSLYNNNVEDVAFEFGFYSTNNKSAKYSFWCPAGKWTKFRVGLSEIYSKLPNFFSSPQMVSLCWPEYVSGGEAEYFLDAMRLENYGTPKIVNNTLENVLEDFSAEDRIANVPSNRTETDGSTAQWLADYQGADGVVKVTTEYYNEYGVGFLQTRFNYDAEKLAKKDWDIISVRLWVDYNAPKVTFYNNRVEVGEYATGEWVSVEIPRELFFTKGSYLLEDLVGNESGDIKNKAFADVYTRNSPYILFYITSSLKNSVTYYIDEINLVAFDYSDETAPTILVTGLTSFTKGETFVALDYVEVTDDRDYLPKVTFSLKTLGGEEVSIENGTAVLSEEGVYEFGVTATDKAGNKATLSHKFEVVSADCFMRFGVDSTSQYVKSGNVEWLSEYEGEFGVMKITADSVYGDLVINLDDTEGSVKIWRMLGSSWNYIKIRLYIEDDNVGSYPLYNSNDVTISESINTNEWVDVILTKGMLFRTGSAIDYGWGTTEAHWNNMLVHGYSASDGHNLARLFMTSEKGTAPVYYIDEIRWGFITDTTAPVINLGEVTDVMLGEEFSLPAIKVFDNYDGNMADYTVGLTGPLGDINLSSDGKAVLTELGSYTLTVTAVDSFGNSSTKGVEFNCVDPNVLLGFNDQADEQAVKSGNAEWLSEYEGELGVMKITADSVYGDLVINLDDTEGSVKIWRMLGSSWNYIKIRLYIEDDNVGSYPLYNSNDVTISESINTNEWVDVMLTKGMLFSAGSAIDYGWGTSEGDWNNMLVFGYSASDGHNLARLFMTSEKGTAPVYYIDEIRWG